MGRDSDKDAFLAKKACKKEAYESFDKMMRQPAQDPKPMIIKAYESILTDKRKKERE